jgi:hypothetical protein
MNAIIFFIIFLSLRFYYFLPFPLELRLLPVERTELPELLDDGLL